MSRHQARPAARSLPSAAVARARLSSALGHDRAAVRPAAPPPRPAAPPDLLARLLAQEPAQGERP